MEENNLEQNIEKPVVFKPAEVFGKDDHFQCNAQGFPTASQKHDWMMGYAQFESELEDLMRKYKVNQVVASIFSKL